jgi:hypothetical protein
VIAFTTGAVRSHAIATATICQPDRTRSGDSTPLGPRDADELQDARLSRLGGLALVDAGIRSSCAAHSS